MTPARERYLQTCSREEMAIRDQIEYTKFQIWRIKGYLNADWRSKDKADEANAKKGLHSRQRAIKALKKQLPCKVGKVTVFTMSDNSEGWTVRICESCGDWVMLGEAPVEEQPTHCPWCGKQLR